MQELIKLYVIGGIYMEYINLKKDVIKVAVEGEESFNLDYSIIQNSDNIYGIEIYKTNVDSDYSERAVVMISDIKEDVVDLMNKLARFEVTPITLDYIIADILD